MGRFFRLVTRLYILDARLGDRPRIFWPSQAILIVHSRAFVRIPSRHIPNGRSQTSQFRAEVRRSSVSRSAHARMTSGSPRSTLYYTEWSDLIIRGGSVQSAAATFSLGSIRHSIL